MQPHDQPNTHAAQAGSSSPGRLIIWLLTAVAALAVIVILTMPHLLGGTVPDTSGFPWHSDYRQAADLAAEQNKPMLLNFTADWCAPCQQMNASVYSEPWVVDALQQVVIPVKIDMTAPGQREQQIAGQFGVKYLPTQVVVGPGANEIARHMGPAPPQSFVQWVENAAQGAAR